MRRLLMLAILVTPLCASAEYLDVIQVKLKERCTPATYVAIKNDFNEHWGKGHGYRAEIAQPVQSNDLVSVFWIVGVIQPLSTTNTTRVLSASLRLAR